MLRWKLKELLDARGLRPREVARLSGVSYRTVRDIYHNRPRNHHLSTLDRLAEALDVPCETLFEHAWEPGMRAPNDEAQSFS